MEDCVKVSFKLNSKEKWNRCLELRYLGQVMEKID